MSRRAARPPFVPKPRCSRLGATHGAASLKGRACTAQTEKANYSLMAESVRLFR